jgi:hypothetical protein
MEQKFFIGTVTTFVEVMACKFTSDLIFRLLLQIFEMEYKLCDVAHQEIYRWRGWALPLLKLSLPVDPSQLTYKMELCHNLFFWGGGVLSIATVLFECFLLLSQTHYMFRPLRAIFRWNTYTGYFLRSYFSTVDPLFLFGYQLYIYIYIYIFFFS